MRPRWRGQRRAVVGGAIVVSAALVAAATGACGSDDPDPPAATTSSTTTATPDDLERLGLALVDELVVADPDPARPDYERDEWEEGLDVDGDCLRTRHEVLAEESVVPPVIDGCRVTGGTWWDPLTGDTFTDPEQLQVDHLVALADAHRSGGWRWDAARKAAYANDLTDPDHLNAVDGGENQRKADDGPDAYRPADPNASCWYAVAYARVKVTWELTVTASQRDGLVDLLSECAG